MRFVREVMPIFVGIAVLFHGASLLARRDWLQRTRPAVVAGLAAGAGFLAEASTFALALATRELDWRSVWYTPVMMIQTLWLAAGPVLLTVGLIAVAKRRQAGSFAPAV